MSLHQNDRDLLANSCVFLPSQKQFIHGDDEHRVRFIHFLLVILCCFVYLRLFFRILRLRESGLVDEWYKWYVPSISKCMKVNQRNRMPRLSIKHLSSAFVILAAGYIISFSVLVAERVARNIIIFHRAAVVVWLSGVVYFVSSAVNREFIITRRQQVNCISSVYSHLNRKCIQKFFPSTYGSRLISDK